MYARIIIEMAVLTVMVAQSAFFWELMNEIFSS